MDYSSATETLAWKACLASATEICNLCRVYRQQFGLANIHVGAVHTLVTASLVLCYAGRYTALASEAEQQQILTCINMLSELSKTFDTGVRALEIVTSLRREWALPVLQPYQARQRAAASITGSDGRTSLTDAADL